MNKMFITFSAISFLSVACTTHVKKIIVYGNNDMVINQDAKTITEKDTDGHVEKEITYATGDKLTLLVKTAAGDKTIEIPEDGYYIVNLKAKDTIVGGYQSYSAPSTTTKVISQDQLKHDLDSLRQMAKGLNTNAANRSFFIQPYTSAKITANTDAKIVGPYHQMTSVQQTGDKEPEVYRFHSMSEMRETIANLENLTGDTTTEKK